MEKDFVFLATGDIGMNRENPSSIFDGVRDTLNKGDLVFGQLEPCLASVGTPACQSRLPMRGDPKDYPVPHGNWDIFMYSHFRDSIHISSPFSWYPVYNNLEKG